LSTAVSQIGYEYRDGMHMIHTGIKLKGRYPALNMYLDYGGEPNVIRAEGEADSTLALPRDLSFLAQAYVPLRINTGKYLTLLQPRIDYRYSRELQYIEEEGTYRTGAHYLYYSFYASSYLRMGKREILPRLGLTASGGYYHAPFDNQVVGAATVAGLTGYLPGIMKHHTIKLALQRQVQYLKDPGRPAYLTLMKLPRGKNRLSGEVLTRYSVDYVFPILYPDLEIGPVLYIQRIRGGIWTDYLVGKDVYIPHPSAHLEDRAYQTWGIDLVADMNFLRISFPLSLGGRVIRDRDLGVTTFQWIYAIEIN
jgi:hypothetical protein